jgi:predicted NUDIX family NTP pyrophosphohydrolase
VHAWAWEGDADCTAIRSNTMRCEWPRGSQHFITVPEIDRCEWFDSPSARFRINAAQTTLLDRLEEMLRLQE